MEHQPQPENLEAADILPMVDEETAQQAYDLAPEPDAPVLTPESARDAVAEAFGVETNDAAAQPAEDESPRPPHADPFTGMHVYGQSESTSAYNRHVQDLADRFWKI